MKTLRLAVTGLVVPAAVIGLQVAAGAQHGRKHDDRVTATLAGRQEVPIVCTAARGRFDARVAGDESSLEWNLTYSGLQGVVPPANSGKPEKLLHHVHPGNVGVEHLPSSMRSGAGSKAPGADRRRQTADDLYDALVTHGASFWQLVYPTFLARDITRHDLRELVRRGLRESKGRYKTLLRLFGMSTRDYRRFMNFLAAHDCGVGFREFRGSVGSLEAPSENLVPYTAGANSLVPLAPLETPPAA